MIKTPDALPLCRPLSYRWRDSNFTYAHGLRDDKNFNLQKEPRVRALEMEGARSFPRSVARQARKSTIRFFFPRGSRAGRRLWLRSPAPLFASLRRQKSETYRFHCEREDVNVSRRGQCLRITSPIKVNNDARHEFIASCRWRQTYKQRSLSARAYTSPSHLGDNWFRTAR